MASSTFGGHNCVSIYCVSKCIVSIAAASLKIAIRVTAFAYSTVPSNVPVCLKHFLNAEATVSNEDQALLLLMATVLSRSPLKLELNSSD